MAGTKIPKTKGNRDIAKRWTKRLIEGGFTPVSTYFLENYHRLKMSTTEAMFIIQLMRHKWDERHPHPAFKTLAKRLGVSTTAARAYARNLEKKRLLNRIVTSGAPNRFDLTPLFDALERLYLRDKKEVKTAKSQAAPPAIVEDDDNDDDE